MQKTIPAHNGGFSLIELIVAISILSIGLLATATMLAKGIGAIGLSNNVTVESRLAYSVLDEITSRSASDALFGSSVTNASYDLDPSAPAMTRNIQGTDYAAAYSIRTDTPVTGVASISVTVTGAGRSYSLSSIKRSI